MRFTSVITLACAIAAFILSILCLFAGSMGTTLQNADLLTLNVSRIGHTEVFDDNNGDGFFSDIVDGIQSDLNDLISNFTTDIAQSLNLSDFYAVHVMNYCEGNFEPNSTVDDADKNTTACSRRNALFHFDPTAILNSQLPEGITLTDLQWPSQIEDASRAVRIASRVMVIFYCVGIGFAGLSIFGAIWGFFTSGRLSACMNILLNIMTFITIGAASGIATAISVEAVKAINQYGEDIGVSGTRGNLFLGMTWTATAVMFVALLVSTFQCCTGRRKKANLNEKPRHGSY